MNCSETRRLTGQAVGVNGKSRIHADFARFFISGGIAAAIHFALLHVGIAHLHWEGTVATTVGLSVAICVSYFLNYYWTFKAAIPHVAAMPRFLVVSLSGLGLNAAIFATAHYGLDLHYLVAQVFATGLVLFWNFFLQRTWSFSGK